MTQTAINIRHNGFGVDIIGGEANVDMAMLALNTQPDLLAAAKSALAYIEEQVERIHGPSSGGNILRAALAKAEGN